jgi:hypothetical protein
MYLKDNNTLDPSYHNWQLDWNEAKFLKKQLFHKKQMKMNKEKKHLEYLLTT